MAEKNEEKLPILGLLPGEIEVAKALNVLRFSTMADRRSGISGVLYATNFRISFLTRSPNTQTALNSVFQSNPDLTEAGDMYSDIEREMHIAQTCITSVFYYHTSTAEGTRIKKMNLGSRSTSKVFSIEIHCKDFRVVRFGLKFTPKDDRKQIVKVIAYYRAPTSLSLLFAFPYSAAMNSLEGGGKTKMDTVPTFRTLPDWESELSRLNVDDTWRVASVNRNFETCPSLSQHFVVLASLSDSDIKRMSLHYIDSRLPIWCWSHPVTGIPMFYCESGRPESIFLEKEETSFFRALSLIPCNTEHKDVKVVNLSKLCPTVKELQLGFAKIKELCVLETTKAFWSIDSHWLSSLEVSKWLQYLRISLVAAMDVVKSIWHDHSPVIIKETGGRDFVLVVASIAQLILDPYYRTIRGFQTLVQKMWVMGGHQFLQRCGHIRKSPLENEKEDSWEAPVFLHFIDCIYQLTQQFPSEFEFSETYLLGLLDTMHGCMFDTFLFDCEKQREEFSQMEQKGTSMASLWDFVGEQLSDSRISGPYMNPLFEYRNSVRVEEELNGTSDDSYLQVNTLAPGIKFWSGCYLRWLPTVHVSTGMGENSALHLQQMILVSELRVLRHRLACNKYMQNQEEHPDYAPEGDTFDFDIGTDFNLDLETSQLLTPSLPFIGDLSLNKYCADDTSKDVPQDEEESVEVSRF